MASNPALALIRQKQLLSALFIFHFRVHALKVIIPKISHSAKTLELTDYSILIISPPMIKMFRASAPDRVQGLICLLAS